VDGVADRVRDLDVREPRLVRDLEAPHAFDRCPCLVVDEDRERRD